MLARALGRDPRPGELYFTHQQGVAGGPALLTADPSTPAWQVVRPFYSDKLARSRGFASGDEMAQAAVTGNIHRGSSLYGRPAGDISAGDFRAYWIDKFERGMPGQQSGAPKTTAVASAQEAPVQNLSLDQLAMGLPGQGTMPVAPGNGAPLNLVAAGQPGAGGPTGMLSALFGQGPGTPGLLSGAMGGAGQQQRQQPQFQPLQPLQMPVPVGLRNPMLAAILQRGSAV